MTRTQRQIEEHRKGDVCLEVLDAAGRPWPGVPVWAEQESHAFVFGCVAPDLDALTETDRQRCAARLNEVFNRLASAGLPPEPGVIRVDVPEAVDLGRFRLDLDRLASAGLPLEICVRGRSVGLGFEPEGSGASSSGERAAAERAAALYTLCFAHPAVRGIYWHGFWDGEEGVAGGGLLRHDFAPRPAFRYLHKLIGTIWHSRASGETDQEGQFRFRGFFGDYRVAARIGEEAATTAVLSCRPGAGSAPCHLSLRGPACSEEAQSATIDSCRTRQGATD